MTAVKWIVAWGLVSLLAAVVGGVLAYVRNRDHSWWAAWCFIFPPLLVFLIFLPRNPGPKPRRQSLDDEDRQHELI
jgi:apolipoprotein N-acyltransferase